jgi:hypothetical protein
MSFSGIGETVANPIKTTFLRRFFTMPDHAWPLWIVCHRSVNASGGMSGCRTMFWGSPRHSSSGKPLLFRNASFA